MQFRTVGGLSFARRLGFFSFLVIWFTRRAVDFGVVVRGARHAPFLFLFMIGLRGVDSLCC